MDRLKGVWKQLRVFVRKEAVERELEEEVRFHVEMETRRLVREEGLEAGEARRCALIEFGGVEQAKERVREARWTRWAEDVAQDVRYAARTLTKRPGITAAGVLTLALGVGVTTAVFSVANAMLLRPLPVADPDGLVVVRERRGGQVVQNLGYMAIPYERYGAYREAVDGVFSGLAAGRHGHFSLRAPDGAVAVSGVLASENYFAVLGLRPALGRFFADADERAVVLSNRVWQGRFGGDPGVVGRTAQVDGRPFTIVGVAPRGFRGTSMMAAVELWLPIEAYAFGAGAGWGAAWVVPFGRLRADVDASRAAAVIDALAQRIPPQASHTRVRGADLLPMTGLSRSAREAMTWFFGMLLATAGLVLLIASANIAGMLLARGAARRREIAMRRAIGAGRGRLVRQLMTESALLFAIGGGGGILLAIGGTRLLASVRLPVVRNAMVDLSPDARVLGFALLVTAATGIVFGLEPALHASRTALAAVLRDGARTAAGGRTRARSAFVTAQLALSVVLLVMAGLFVRSLRQGLAVDPGFDPDGVVVGATNLASHGYDDVRGRAFYRRLLERVRALPGVEAAGLSENILLGGGVNRNDIESADAGPSGPRETNIIFTAVDPGYFETMRVPIVAGRALTRADVSGAPPAAVVNRTLARRLWPDASPLGKRFRMGGTAYEVVGVARDGKYASIQEVPTPFAFLAFAQRYAARMTLHVRSRESATETLARVRRAVRALDPNVALEDAMPLPVLVGFSLLPYRWAAFLVGLFGLIGLVLAAVGVYAVLAFHVAERTREFGIRVALGARASDVLRSVLGRGALTAAVGAAVGLVLAAAVTRFLRSFFFGVSPLDPATFAAVALVLAAIALVASYVPARRATRVDPMAVLRDE